MAAYTKSIWAITIILAAIIVFALACSTPTITLADVRKAPAASGNNAITRQMEKRQELAEKRLEKTEYINTRHAVFIRGQAYYGKDGDYVMAAKLWHRAAMMCDTSAQSSLGYLYYIGMGVKQSYPQAMKWYRRAAEAGAADAQYNLAVMYSRGEGTPKDSVQAMAWFIAASANGSHDAAHELRYIENIATPEQISEARSLAKRNGETDHVDRCPVPAGS